MICPYCNKEVKCIPNEEVYGRRYGKSYMCYYCKDCNAYVGVHQNDPNRPLGTMANKELRLARMKVHRLFDPLWKSGDMNRKEAYKILNKHFGFEVHIGESDLEMCNKIYDYVKTLRE